jgi:hypothetical protein
MTGAIGFIQTIDEVQTSRPTAPGDRRQAIQKQRLALGRKRAGFLMAHVDELNLATRQAGRKSVQRVPDDAVAMPDAGAFEDLYDDFRYFLAHG